MSEMIERKSWEEFRASGLLWWINRTLHLFGWAIVVGIESDGEVFEVYPARVRFRGFDTDSEIKGFIALTDHLGENIKALQEEAGE
jgi:hypothetical protein